MQWPILEVKDIITVNELMLQRTYGAVILTVVSLVVYLILVVVVLVTTKQTTKNRRNLWLKDNSASHDYAYLLTIKTGTQKHAGTGAKVLILSVQQQ